MRLGLAAMAGLLAATGVQAQVTNNVAPGSLAATVDPGCVTLAEADSRLSPPDLGLGVLACAREAAWDKAADLYALMILRSTFDTERVADETAHQAGEVLSMQLADSLSDVDRERLGAALATFADPAAPQRAAFCRAVKAAAVPQHDPSWMLQHGMGAFLGNAGDGLVTGFDAPAAWDRIVRVDMACG